MKTSLWNTLNPLSLAIIAFTLCGAAPSYAGGLVAVWGNASYAETTLPVGVSNVKSISARGNHLLALRSDGSVIGWGDNSSGQNNIPAELAWAVAIAAGGSHNLALKPGGAVAAWGSNSQGQTDVPSDLSDVSAIAAGASHSLALRADGTVIAWGDNSRGQTNVPSGLSAVVAVAAGDFHSLALKADGTVVAWGYNFNGQTNVPAGLSNVVAIAAGDGHSLALKADGMIVGWGYNEFGVSTGAAGLSNVVAIAAGNAHSLALLADGTVVAWGDGYNGGTYVPSGLPSATAIAASDHCSLALVADGPVEITQSPTDQAALYPYTSNLIFSVTAAGQSPSYQWFLNGTALRDGPRLSGSTTPSLVISNLQPSDIGSYTVAVMNAFGSVVSPGASITPLGAPAPTQAPSNQVVRAGSDVLLSDPVLGAPPLTYQWFLNGTGLVGATNITLLLTNAQPNATGAYSLMVTNAYGSTQVVLSLSVTDSPPYIVGQPSGASVSAGGSFGFAASARGSLPLGYQWRFNGQDISGATNSTLTLNHLNGNQNGYYDLAVSNPFGQAVSAKVLLSVIQGVYVWWPQPYGSLVSTNVLPGLPDATAIAAGSAHLLVLRRGGTVATWSAPGVYVPPTLTNIPPNLNNVIAIAAAGNSSMALRADGTVVVWGDNSYGQTSVPLSATNVTAIADGGGHCLALKSNGTVVGWGENYSGEINPPPGLSNTVAVAAAVSVSFALRNDGTVVAWGHTNGYTPAMALTNVLAISASSPSPGLAEALVTDGSVIDFGPQAGKTPASLSNIVAVSAGYASGSALRSDGTVAWWGFPQTNFPSSISNVTAIAAGGYNYLALFAAIIGDGSPSITIQPFTQTAASGATVRLHARAVGAQPLSYQWQLGGADLPNATNADLTITNVQDANVGSYQAVVSSALGSVTTRAAQLTIPAIQYNGGLAAALNATNLAWITSPTNAPWFAESSVVHDGEAAAQSGHIGDSRQSTLQTTVTGPGVLSFWWKVSSEESYDFLRFYIDGTNRPAQASISGEADWQQLTINIASGAHALQWMYSKDPSVSVGQDVGWLDQVTFIFSPLITQQPLGQTNWMGSDATLQAGGSWSGIAFLQWLKNGTNLPNAHSILLTLTNLTRHDSGTYALQISNAAGGAISSNATLLVLVPQRLAAPRLLPDGSFVVSSADADGGLLQPEDVLGLKVQASTNLVDWATLPNMLALTNGSLTFRDSTRTNYAVRFYRAVEH